MIRIARPLAAAFCIAALAAAPGAATAQDRVLPTRVTGVGPLIAAQGNAALVQIRAELHEALIERFDALLPRPSELSRAEPAAGEAPERTVARGLSL